jgi:hypothetical protein
MRAPFSSLLLAVAWLAGTGCASAPQQEPPVTSSDGAGSEGSSLAGNPGSAVAGAAGSTGGTGAFGGTVAMAGATAATSPAAPQSSISSGATPSPARSTLIRKSSLSAHGGSGNGATAQKISPGSDNDIVARRLRKAAEQETDPAVRAKLWKEYANYRQGMSVK